MNRLQGRALCAALLVLLLPGVAVPSCAATAARAEEPPIAAPADLLLAEIDDPRLNQMLREVLERNPELSALKAQARSLGQRPAQARSLPDPHATVTTFLKTPETRVGPQRAMATLSQRFPWFGKLGLRESAADLEAAAGRARVEARRLDRLTEARVLYYEIAFLDAFERLTRTDRDTLIHFEELARARYASGIGLQQDVIKIQAEITKDETQLLDIARRRASAVAALNALRDRTEGLSVPRIELEPITEVRLDLDALKTAAVSRRPEVAAADSEVGRAATLVKLARKEYDPDFTVGLNYTLVDSRDDPAARLSRPEDDGQDVLGLTFGLNLPIRRGRLSAGVNESMEARTSAEGRKRQVFTDIRRAVEDFASRIPLLWSQLRLFDEVLVRQSEESLRSVESAYAAGTVNALDLLDAERVLLDARTASERTHADYAIALARLEGAIAGPVPAPGKEGDLEP